MDKKIIVVLATNIILIASLTPVISANNTSTTIQCTNDTEFWALCIAPYGSTNGERFGFNAMFCKNILLSNGWDEDHINLVTGQINKNDVINAISWLESQSDNNDVILIYMSDHGDIGRFCLYNDEIKYKELDEELDKLEYKGMGIVIHACYSGSAITDLEQNKRVIVTSCKKDETCGHIELLNSLSIVADIFGNNNGKVSLEESFSFMKEYCRELNYSPQISDRYFGELNIMSYDKSKYELVEPSHLYSDVTSDVPIYNGKYDENQIRQSFIAKCKKISGIMIKASNNGDESNKLILQLLDKNENLLIEQTISPPGIYPENEAGRAEYMWIYVELPETSMTIGETYYLVFKKDYTENIENWNLAKSEKNIYKDGEVLYSQDGGETWTPYNPGDEISERDISFLLFGEGKESNNITSYMKLIINNLKMRFRYRFNQLFPNV